MKQRQLGKNGPKVSALGLGCMGMTGFYGEADESLSINVVQRAGKCKILQMTPAY